MANAKTKSEPEVTPEADDDRDKRMSAARSAAATALREAHQEEFNSLLVAEAKSRGIDWQPRKTPEQKRREEFRRLLEEDPSLAALVQGQAPTVVSAEDA